MVISPINFQGKIFPSKYRFTCKSLPQNWKQEKLMQFISEFHFDPPKAWEYSEQKYSEHLFKPLM